MRFAKVHGLGNDFVLLDLRGGGELLAQRRVVELCDRHRGVGADGVLTLLPGDRMKVQNADGSVPEMCGNGARCAALWIATGGGTKSARGPVLLETDAGPRACEVDASFPRSGAVTVEMGHAMVERPRLLGEFEAIPVSIGNPHRVIWGDPALAASVGPSLCERENANIEFAVRLGPCRYQAGVFERGAGLTQACGTGACAIVAAAVANGEARRNEEVVVALPGGELTVRIDREGRARMRGPAELVFVGEL